MLMKSKYVSMRSGTRAAAIGLTVAMLLLSGCVTSTPHSSDTPHEGIARFKQAFNNGDAKALAQVYTEDAKLLPPGMKAITGRDAIAAFWQTSFNRGPGGIEKRPIEILVSGDLATETSDLTVTRGNQKIEGKDILVWKRGPDNQWRIAADIWNLNK
jgi:uncharacterized protein (TIGR02246 family)